MNFPLEVSLFSVFCSTEMLVWICFIFNGKIVHKGIDTVEISKNLQLHEKHKPQFEEQNDSRY